MRKLLAVFVFIVCGLVVSQSLQAQFVIPNYQFVDLGTLGGNYSQPYGVNNSRQVVGVANTSDGNGHPFIYQNGQMTNLDDLYSNQPSLGTPVAINNVGQIVGTLTLLSSNIVISLPKVFTTMPGSTSTLGISDDGIVIGKYNRPMVFGICYWSGDYSSVTSLPFGRVLSAAVNNNDVIAMGQGGPAHNLILFTNDDQNFTYVLTSVPTVKSVNVHNVVVGSLSGSSAFIFDNGQLSLLPGGSVANAINVNGHAVGTDGASAVFWYGPPTNMTVVSLQSFVPIGYSFIEAVGINDEGDIIGYGTLPNGDIHAFMLVPDTVDLPDPPIVVVSPSIQNVGIGSTVNLKVQASGYPPLTYQWYFGTNSLQGETNTSLNIVNADEPQSGEYKVVVTNPGGSTTSAVVIVNVLPVLGITTVPAISITGDVGRSYQLQYIPSIGPTNNWNDVATILITNSPQFYPDYSAIGQPLRFYRVVEIP